MMYTRWGQLHPLRKSLVLSLLAHVLLAWYSTTVYVSPSVSAFQDKVIRVMLSDRSTEPVAESTEPVDSSDMAEPSEPAARRKSLHQSRPWETFGATAAPVEPKGSTVERVEVQMPKTPDRRTSTGEEGLGMAPLEHFSLPASASPDPAVARLPSGRVPAPAASETTAAAIQVPAGPTP